MQSFTADQTQLYIQTKKLYIQKGSRLSPYKEKKKEKGHDLKDLFTKSSHSGEVLDYSPSPLPVLVTIDSDLLLLAARSKQQEHVDKEGGGMTLGMVCRK